MHFDLGGKTALITGGASGIGKAIAERFSSSGATVVIADITPASEMAGQNGWHFIHVDVGDETSVSDMIQQVISIHGKLDILINNAGIQPLGVDFDQLTPSLLEISFRINVFGVMYGIKHAKAVMKTGGRIINTASYIGLLGAPNAAVYGPTRSAIVHITQLAAMELAGRGITVNCVCPGIVKTPAVMDIPDNPEIPFAEKITPLGRLAEPSEIAAAFHFLASDDASYITGIALPVDGGITSGMREHPVIAPPNVVEGKWIP
jgi:NAD(P)-dependent dehydrogenase (short-subunit alcohol dehydrogenase family)